MEAQPAAPLDYPLAEARDTFVSYHGTEVHDPYGWMVNIEDPAVQEWVAAENQLADTWLEQAGSEAVYDQLCQRTDIHGIDTRLPLERGKYFFWTERAPGQDKPIWYRAIRPWDEKARHTVLDPNAELDDHSSRISLMQISPNGKHFIYGISHKGSEAKTLYLRDVANGEEQLIMEASIFDTVIWASNNKGFYYCKHSENNHLPSIEGQAAEQPKAYYRSFDKNRAESDEIIFDAAALGLDAEKQALSVAEYLDGAFLIASYDGFTDVSTDRLFLIDRETGQVQELLSETQTSQSATVEDDGYIYVRTFHGTNNGRVLRTPIDNAAAPVEEWEEFVSEYPEHVLEDFYFLSDRIGLVHYVHLGVHSVELFSPKSGKLLGELPMPPLSTLEDINMLEGINEVHYIASNFLSAGALYRYNIRSKKNELLWQDPDSLDSTQFATRQEWYTSKDGTEIPMFVTAQKDKQHTVDNPTLLYGYGGFGYSITPSAWSYQRLFVEKGGTLVVPSIRGGQEFGDKWHKASIKHNRQNSFDDYIAAAEHVVQQGYTTREQLAISGRSNGGLLVAACLAQRPDLFKAAFAGAPVIDMVDFPNQLMGQVWLHEYGDPSKPEDFKALYNYSPYHNVQDGQKYPHTLVQTGVNDTRVHPMHTFKLIARLQAADPAGTHLMQAYPDTGHFMSENFYQGLQEEAAGIAFIMHHLGIKVIE